MPILYDRFKERLFSVANSESANFFLWKTKRLKNVGPCSAAEYFLRLCMSVNNSHLLCSGGTLLLRWSLGHKEGLLESEKGGGMTKWLPLCFHSIKNSRKVQGQPVGRIMVQVRLSRFRKSHTGMFEIKHTQGVQCNMNKYVVSDVLSYPFLKRISGCWDWANVYLHLFGPVFGTLYCYIRYKILQMF